MYAKWDHIQLYNVSALDITRRFVGDTAVTAGGKLRRDAVPTPVKKVWSIQCIYLTEAEASTLLEYWDNNHYIEGDFWLLEFGSELNTKRCMVDPDPQESIVQFRDDNGTWQKSGRSISFTVREV